MLKIKLLKFNQDNFYQVFIIEISVLRTRSNYYRIFKILDEKIGTDHLYMKYSITTENILRTPNLHIYKFFNAISKSGFYILSCFLF